MYSIISKQFTTFHSLHIFETLHFSLSSLSTPHCVTYDPLRTYVTTFLILISLDLTTLGQYLNAQHFYNFFSLILLQSYPVPLRLFSYSVRGTAEGLGGGKSYSDLGCLCWFFPGRLPCCSISKQIFQVTLQVDNTSRWFGYSVVSGVGGCLHESCSDSGSGDRSGWQSLRWREALLSDHCTGSAAQGILYRLMGMWLFRINYQLNLLRSG